MAISNYGFGGVINASVLAQAASSCSVGASVAKQELAFFGHTKRPKIEISGWNGRQ